MKNGSVIRVKNGAQERDRDVEQRREQGRHVEAGDGLLDRVDEVDDVGLHVGARGRASSPRPRCCRTPRAATGRTPRPGSRRRRRTRRSAADDDGKNTTIVSSVASPRGTRRAESHVTTGSSRNARINPMTNTVIASPTAASSAIASSSPHHGDDPGRAGDVQPREPGHPRREGGRGRHRQCLRRLGGRVRQGSDPRGCGGRMFPRRCPAAGRPGRGREDEPAHDRSGCPCRAPTGPPRRSEGSRRPRISMAPATTRAAPPSALRAATSRTGASMAIASTTSATPRASPAANDRTPGSTPRRPAGSRSRRRTRR